MSDGRELMSRRCADLHRWRNCSASEGILALYSIAESLRPSLSAVIYQHRRRWCMGRKSRGCEAGSFCQR